ncbi:MAG: hypothetical protein D6683_01495 [Actinomyces sp.]|nr:MAG: hypothetical protein D6683_01495 [Actinomyces sp.]
MRTQLNEFQQRAVARFRERDHLVLNFATGAGKTLAALACAEDVKPQRILLLVAEKAHIDQVWKAEIAKHGIDLEHVEIEAYHQWHARPKHGHYDLLIYDEAHLITPRVVSILSQVRFGRTLWLTGTLEPERMDRILSLCPDVDVLSVGLDETTASGTTKAVDVLLVPVSGNTPHVFTKTIGRGSKPMLVTEVQARHLSGRQCVTIKGTFAHLYGQFSQLIRMYRSNENIRNRAGLMRKQLMVSLKSIALSRHFPDMVAWARRNDKRILVWSMNKMSFRPLVRDPRLAEVLGSKPVFRRLAYYSDNPDRQRVYEAWLAGQRPFIYASKLLVTGANLPQEADLFLAVSLEYKSLAGILQKLGRITRHGGTLVIPYVVGTKEEDVIAKLKRKLPKTWNVKTISIDELSRRYR